MTLVSLVRPSAQRDKCLIYNFCFLKTYGILIARSTMRYLKVQGGNENEESIAHY